MQAAIEVAKAAIMAVREAENPVNNTRLVYTTRLRHSALRQPVFDWKATNKHQELCSF